MKQNTLPKIFVAMAIVFPAVALRAQPTTAPAANRVTLFNGKDTVGWRLFLEDKTIDPKTAFSIVDGAIKFDTKPRGYLVTEKSYSNYHLHVEWRWPKEAVRNSNSGIMVHQTGPDVIWPKSFEVQLQNQNAGQVVGMDNDIPAAPIQGNPPRKRAAKLAPQSEKPLGEWNSVDIHAKGETIEVFVNGVRQNYVEKLPATAGAISLQTEGFPIDFRNVWLEPK